MSTVILLETSLYPVSSRHPLWKTMPPFTGRPPAKRNRLAPQENMTRFRLSLHVMLWEQFGLCADAPSAQRMACAPRYRKEVAPASLQENVGSACLEAGAGSLPFSTSSASY